MASYDLKMSLLAHVAWMYYIQGLTQEKISKKMGFSRSKVTYLLTKAKQNGIVEINIRNDFRFFLELEQRLTERFGLKDVIVVPSGDTEEQNRNLIGKACADLLERILHDADVVGWSWSRYLYQIADPIGFHRFDNLVFVQLMGGMNTDDNINPHRMIESITSKLNASSIWLHTPVVVKEVETKKALLSDEGVQKVLRIAEKCTKALLSLGRIDYESSMIRSGSLTKAELSILETEGAVGNLMGRYFDIQGCPIENSIMGRVISLSLEKLKSIPVRILNTSGPDRAKAILGAIRGKYINVFITDQNTAEAVLDLAEASDSG